MNDSDAPATSPATAKARFLALALRAAAAAGLKPGPQATFAILIAESWWRPAGWTASIALATIANRLSCSRGQAKRYAGELASAGFASRRPGRGQTQTEYLLVLPDVHQQRGCAGAPSESAPARRGGSACAPPEGALAHRGERAGAPSEGAPAHPNSVSQNSISISTGAAAAAAAEVVVVSETEQACFARLTQRPAWLHQKKPWLDRATARQLARELAKRADLDAGVAADWAIRLAYQRREVLDNPVGFVVKTLRSPDPESVTNHARNLAALARRRAHQEPLPVFTPTHTEQGDPDHAEARPGRPPAK